MTDIAITKAGFIFTVTANAEQIPKTCTVIGLLDPNGSVISLIFLLENRGSFSELIVYYFFKFLK